MQKEFRNCNITMDKGKFMYRITGYQTLISYHKLLWLRCITTLQRQHQKQQLSHTLLGISEMVF